MTVLDDVGELLSIHKSVFKLTTKKTKTLSAKYDLKTSGPRATYRKLRVGEQQEDFQGNR